MIATRTGDAHSAVSMTSCMAYTADSDRRRTSRGWARFASGLPFRSRNRIGLRTETPKPMMRAQPSAIMVSSRISGDDFLVDLRGDALNQLLSQYVRLRSRSSICVRQKQTRAVAKYPIYGRLLTKYRFSWKIRMPFEWRIRYPYNCLYIDNGPPLFKNQKNLQNSEMGRISLFTKSKVISSL